jgi:uncharacterized protein (TIGR02246 family)
MKAQTAQTGDEEAVRSIHMTMIDAWNAGDAEAFIAPFTDDADFVAFEGTHLKGREAMVGFHRQIFNHAVKGTHLEGEVKFIRFLTPELAVMHSQVGMAFAGKEHISPSRNSMQLTVAIKQNGEWRAAALMNARKVSLDQQMYLDRLAAGEHSGHEPD